MKIVVFIFIQFGSLLFYAAHASNIKQASSPSIEHLFSPSVTIIKTRKLIDLVITAESLVYRPVFQETLGTFPTLDMPFSVKGAPDIKYELYLDRTSHWFSFYKDLNSDELELREYPFRNVNNSLDNVPIITQDFHEFSLNKKGQRTHTFRLEFPRIDPSPKRRLFHGKVSLIAYPIIL